MPTDATGTWYMIYNIGRHYYLFIRCVHLLYFLHIFFIFFWPRCQITRFCFQRLNLPKNKQNKTKNYMNGIVDISSLKLASSLIRGEVLPFNFLTRKRKLVWRTRQIKYCYNSNKFALKGSKSCSHLWMNVVYCCVKIVQIGFRKP